MSQQPYTDTPYKTYQTLQYFKKKETPLNLQTSVKTDLSDKSEIVNNTIYGDFYTKVIKHKVLGS
jgi:hypothetical protein